MSQTTLDPILEGAGVGTGRWMVVIYNNDSTSMDEVVDILIRATGCDLQEAMIEMWEAHTFGKAPVHFSSKSVCEEAAAIIQTVTEVAPEWND